MKATNLKLGNPEYINENHTAIFDGEKYTVQEITYRLNPVRRVAYSSDEAQGIIEHVEQHGELPNS